MGAGQIRELNQFCKNKIPSQSIYGHTRFYSLVIFIPLQIVNLQHLNYMDSSLYYTQLFVKEIKRCFLPLAPSMKQSIAHVPQQYQI
jgi:hypothetical protein